MRERPRTRRGDAGYTLVEMVVVVSVIALAAAVIVPGIWRAEAQGREAVVLTLAHVYEEAREEGVRRGGEAQVWLDAAGGRWVALARDTQGERWDTLGTGVLESPDVRLEVPGARWAVVRFDARGRSSGPAVTARGREGPATLHPDAWTGRVHVDRR